MEKKDNNDNAFCVLLNASTSHTAFPLHYLSHCSTLCNALFHKARPPIAPLTLLEVGDKWSDCICGLWSRLGLLLDGVLGCQEALTATRVAGMLQFFVAGAQSTPQSSLTLPYPCTVIPTARCPTPALPHAAQTLVLSLILLHPCTALHPRRRAFWKKLKMICSSPAKFFSRRRRSNCIALFRPSPRHGRKRRVLRSHPVLLPPLVKI